MSSGRKTGRLGWILLFFLLTIAVMPMASAQPSMNCGVVPSDPDCSAFGGVPVLRMSYTTNAHAETVANNNYPYTLCCVGQNGLTLDTNYDQPFNEVLFLSADANAHAQTPAFGIANPSLKYPVEVYLSSTEPLKHGVRCNMYDSACPASGDYECLASISSSTTGSNAHIGACTAYQTKVCCNATLLDTEGPRVDWTLLHQTPTNDPSNLYYQGLATDDQGMKDVEYQYKQAGVSSWPGTWSGATALNPPFDTGTEPFGFTIPPQPEGSHNIRIRGIDAADNIGYMNYTDLLIDWTAPTTTPKVVGDYVTVGPITYYTTDVDITLECVDPDPQPGYDKAGCANTSYCYTYFTDRNDVTPANVGDCVLAVADYDPSTFNVTLPTFTQDGVYFLWYYSNDSAWNREFLQYIEFRVAKELPVVTQVNDTRFGDPLYTDDVDNIRDTFGVGVSWNASSNIETSPNITAYNYTVRLKSDDSLICSDAWEIISPSSDSVLMHDDISCPLEVDKEYYTEITAIDEIGRSVLKASDGFWVRPCEGLPCGSACTAYGMSGVCNGTGCYTDGGCDLNCSPPGYTSGGYPVRMFIDQVNNPVPGDDFRDDVNAFYCDRDNATICGPASLCNESMIEGNCSNLGGACTGLTASWSQYITPNPAEFYGPNRPFTIQILGISMSPSMPAGFEPLIECEIALSNPPMYFSTDWLEKNKTYYFDRFGRTDAVFTFPDTGYPIPESPGMDGEWNLTRCALKSGFAKNGGWDLFVDETNHTIRIDSVPPMSSIMSPPDAIKVGRRFNVTWDGIDPRAGIKSYEFQYIEKDWMEYYEYTCTDCDFDACWRGLEPECMPYAGEYSGTGTRYDITGRKMPYYNHERIEFCYRIRATDNADNVEGWSCDPETNGTLDECNCVNYNTTMPENVSIKSDPAFWQTADPSQFALSWGANNAKCYQVEYNMTDERGGPGINWTPLSTLNNMFDVPVWNDSIGPGGDVSMLDCTDLTGYVFDPAVIVGVDLDKRVYGFRVRAVSDVTGAAINSSWEYASSRIDRGAPVVECNVTSLENGQIIPIGGSIFTGKQVGFTAAARKDGMNDVDDVWMEWKVVSALNEDNIIIDWEKMVFCQDNSGTSLCTATKGPWEEDLRLYYRCFANNTAGIVSEDDQGLKNFYVYRELGLITSVRDMYMTLGSFEYVVLDISNRRSDEEAIEIRTDGYPWFKFVNVADATLSPDKRKVNFTLLPLETRAVTMLFYTADVDDYDMIIYANSTEPGHEHVNDSTSIKIRVVFPAEFDGMSWIAVIVLIWVAAAFYIRLGPRQE